MITKQDLVPRVHVARYLDWPNDQLVDFLDSRWRSPYRNRRQFVSNEFSSTSCAVQAEALAKLAVQGLCASLWACACLVVKPERL
eukprot:1907427-Amphidinium_carterae.1